MDDTEDEVVCGKTTFKMGLKDVGGEGIA